MTFRACVIVPTYDNPMTLRECVERCHAQWPDVLVIDDGSHAEARDLADELAAEGLCEVVHRPQNGGKGAAVKTGFREARSRGFTHVLQADADLAHDLEQIGRFLELAEEHPDAMILGIPIFPEQGVPTARRFVRDITHFWVNLETGGRVIHDALCGFRVYPVEDALALEDCGDRMDFDPEIAVRMVWRGVPVINVPLDVFYNTPEEGGVSHFRVFEDNVRISWMHTKLCVEKIFGRLAGRRYGGTVRVLPEVAGS